MDEWFAAFMCWWVLSVQMLCTVCLCEIRCKQNKLSCCSAVFLMFCPKSTTQNTLKNTLSVSQSLIPFSLAHVQMAFIGIKYKGSYCQNKSNSCKQHEIVIGGKKLPNINAGMMSKSSNWLNPIFALKRLFAI